MMEAKALLGTAAAALSLVQYGPYIRDVLRGRTRPHAFSWFIWGLPCLIVFAAQFLEGGGAGSWTTAATAFLCTLVFVLALFRGERHITYLDWASFLAALAAILLWALVKNPLGSVILITLMDLLGFIPTIRKSIDKPHEETLSAYAIGALKWVLSMGAFDHFSPTVWLYPSAMALANGLFVVMLMLRRRRLGYDKRP